MSKTDMNITDRLHKGFSGEVANWWAAHSEYEMALVKHFMEADDDSSMNKFKVDGASKIIVFPGYISWIKKFLSNEEISKILPKEGKKNLQNLCKSLELNVKYLLDREKLAEKICEQLEEKNTAYIHYGSHDRMHANIFKISKEFINKPHDSKEVQYFFTIYNAGAFIEESVTVDYGNMKQGDVATHEKFAKYFHPISNKDRLYSVFPEISYTKLPILDNDQKIIFPAIKYPINKDIKEQINNFLNQSAKSEVNKKFSEEHKNTMPFRENEKLVVATQKTGTCSTRSLSEAARDALGVKGFRIFHDFVKNSSLALNANNNDPIILKTIEEINSKALEIIEKKYEFKINKQVPLTQSSEEIIKNLFKNNIDCSFYVNSLVRSIATAGIEHGSFDEQKIGRQLTLIAHDTHYNFTSFNNYNSPCNYIKKINLETNSIEFIDGSVINSDIMQDELKIETSKNTSTLFFTQDLAQSLMK